MRKQKIYKILETINFRHFLIKIKIFLQIFVITILSLDDQNILRFWPIQVEFAAVPKQETNWALNNAIQPKFQSFSILLKFVREKIVDLEEPKKKTKKINQFDFDKF